MVLGNSYEARYRGRTSRSPRRHGAFLLFVAVSVVLVLASLFTFGWFVMGCSLAIGAFVLGVAVLVFVSGSLKAYQLQTGARKVGDLRARR